MVFLRGLCVFILGDQQKSSEESVTYSLLLVYSRKLLHKRYKMCYFLFAPNKNPKINVTIEKSAVTTYDVNSLVVPKKKYSNQISAMPPNVATARK